MIKRIKIKRNIEKYKNDNNKYGLIFFPELPPTPKRKDPLSLHKRRAERLLRLFNL